MHKRCEWCEKDDLYKNYHDNEWGVICKDDDMLFEYLILESMQAGLSWHIVLKKREAMREAFDGFDAKILANYDDEKVNSLMQNDKILKNRLKLKSLSANAKAFLKVKSEFGSFYEYIWRFVNHKQIINNNDDICDIPAKTALSDTIARDLKKRGFKFLGSISVYAYLQAIGVIDDHLNYCFKRQNGKMQSI
ncbi:DNA-3-methyladenine glycosylase I [Campylobacter majalis]|uniref:DNA-3-methyladenine glycosylase I n=1 Tax=Campylobacter majalis TaxID=2790656 RepID=UPI003D683084